MSRFANDWHLNKTQFSRIQINDTLQQEDLITRLLSWWIASVYLFATKTWLLWVVSRLSYGEINCCVALYKANRVSGIRTWTATGVVLWNEEKLRLGWILDQLKSPWFYFLFRNAFQLLLHCYVSSWHTKNAACWGRRVLRRCSWLKRFSVKSCFNTLLFMPSLMQATSLNSTQNDHTDWKIHFHSISLLGISCCPTAYETAKAKQLSTP